MEQKKVVSALITESWNYKEIQRHTFHIFHSFLPITTKINRFLIGATIKSSSLLSNSLIWASLVSPGALEKLWSAPGAVIKDSSAIININHCLGRFHTCCTALVFISFTAQVIFQDQRYFLCHTIKETTAQELNYFLEPFINIGIIVKQSACFTPNFKSFPKQRCLNGTQ